MIVFAARELLRVAVAVILIAAGADLGVHVAEVKDLDVDLLLAALDARRQPRAVAVLRYLVEDSESASTSYRQDGRGAPRQIRS